MFAFFFPAYSYVYEPILVKIYMNANIMKAKMFHDINYDLRGQ